MYLYELIEDLNINNKTYKTGKHELFWPQWKLLRVEQYPFFLKQELIWVCLEYNIFLFFWFIENEHNLIHIFGKIHIIEHMVEII